MNQKINYFNTNIKYIKINKIKIKYIFFLSEKFNIVCCRQIVWFCIGMTMIGALIGWNFYSNKLD